VRNYERLFFRSKQSLRKFLKGEKSMTEEQRNGQDHYEQMGDPTNQEQGGAWEFINKGVEAANKFAEKLQNHSGATGAVLGTILGCLTLKAFTKAWPRLETPVMAAGYLVGGYAAYRLVKAASKKEDAEHGHESEASAECGQA
jgi:hypothetical protein